MGLAADILQAADVRKVKVGGEIGKRIDLTVANNLMVLDLDRDFLAPFREPNAEQGYVGLGKTIDAFVRFAAYTGDAKVLERKRYLVGETIATQEPDGYIGTIAPAQRMWELWDIHEMAYLVLGLTTDYRYFSEQASLEAARRLADYIVTRWKAEPEQHPGHGMITEYIAFTGLETAFLTLFEASGDRRYFDFAAHFRGLGTWDGSVVRGRWGTIDGHAYAYVCRALAQLRLNRIEPNPELRKTSQKAMDFLMKGDGLTITGTCGQHECWHDTQEGAANLGETCATAYLMRWWDTQFRMDARAEYGDLIERAVYNALFAAQSPDGRKIRYYSPFEGPRVYFDKDSYCCPCNYRRIVAELPGMIYYDGEKEVCVNLYTTSSAELSLPGVGTVLLRQETGYPRDGKVALNLEPASPAEFTLALRIPSWCDGATVTVNGASLGVPVVRGEFCRIARTWTQGDRVELTLPMKLRLVRGYKAQSGRAAVMYGPRVFCLDRERNPALAKEDLRLITLDTATLSGPVADAAAGDGSLCCTVRAWRATNWYPLAETDWEITLTEFPDPEGEASYFLVPNPADPGLTEEVLRH